MSRAKSPTGKVSGSLTQTITLEVPGNVQLDESELEVLRLMITAVAAIGQLKSRVDALETRLDARENYEAEMNERGGEP